MNENTSNKRRILYVFIDESGNFDCSPKGTKYFVLTGFVTYRPVWKRDALHQFRYTLLNKGVLQIHKVAHMALPCVTFSPILCRKSPGALISKRVPLQQYYHTQGKKQ